MLKKLAIGSFTLLVLLTLMGAGTVDPSWIELLTPIYYAVVAGNYALASALAIIAAVWLTRRYLSTPVPWFVSSQGGAVLTLVFGSATGLAAALAVPGAHINLDMVKSAVIQGINAAGTYILVKHIIIDPYIRPWAARATGALKAVLQLALSLFDQHQPTFAEVISRAEKAGVNAVIENPASGVKVIVGEMRTVE